MIVDWYPVSAAPRDGTSVILWTDPVVPMTVGFWVTNHMIEVSY